MGLRILLSLTHVASGSDSCKGKSISLELGKHVFSQTKRCEIRRFVTLLRNYHPHRHVASVSGSCKLRISLSVTTLSLLNLSF